MTAKLKFRIPIRLNPPELPAKLDFSRYRSEELAESLAELISVPGRILTIVRTAGVVVILAAIPVIVAVYFL